MDDFLLGAVAISGRPQPARIRRRKFIVLLSIAMSAQPLGVWAEVTSKCPLIAVLLGSSSIAAARWLSGFPQGLKELSYVEGRNIDIAYLYADGDLTRMPGLADELVRLRPYVFVTGTVAGTLAARLDMSADVAITEREVTVRFHRRAHLPIVLASELFHKPVAVPWWNGLPLRFVE